MTEPYYDRDGITIYNGDCLEVLPTLGPVDHVITDPPYSEHVHSKSRAGSRELNGTGFIADYSRTVGFGFEAMDALLRHRLAAALRVHRWVLVFSDVESTADWRAALTMAGMDYVRTGAWHKLAHTPQFTGDRPAVSFEAITICHPPGRKRWNGGGGGSLWAFAIAQNHSSGPIRTHPTQKPLPLMRELVRLFTDPGDLILDPFMGSGTTLVAARLEGRRAIGIELEEKWCQVAVDRLEHGDKAAAQISKGATPLPWGQPELMQ